jgi:hypothetical protein
MTRRGSSEVVLLNTGNYPGASDYLNTTWTWTPSAWTAVSTSDIDASGPLPLRSDFSMAYDGTRVVLYGGRGASELDGVLQDTWYWNGTAWSKQTPTTVPFGRFGHKMVYQSFGTPGAIMFGGTNVLDYLNETWKFTSGDWSLLSPSTKPPARIGHAMAASASIVLLFGGQNSNSCLNDVWSFDGSTWSAVSTTGAPSVRTDACMAYDTANTKFVLFGGRNENGIINPETYTSTDGTSWTKEAPTTTPSARVGAQLAYDGTNVIMFGGAGLTEANSETWKWNGVTKDWSLI